MCFESKSYAKRKIWLLKQFRISVGRPEKNIKNQPLWSGLEFDHAAISRAETKKGLAELGEKAVMTDENSSDTREVLVGWHC